jgi:hypothetical protein
MKHFSTEEWVDFVNEMTSQAQTKAMQAHLQAGCQDCSKTATIWKRVRDAAGREADMQVPKSVLQHLQNAFVVMVQPKQKDRLFELPRLIFDSVWQPTEAGVRATAAMPRQMLYQAGGIVIEMRVEAKPNSDRMSLEGQVMDAVLKGKGIDCIPVQLLEGQAKLAETSTNKFGEFHMEFESSKRLQISFGISEKKDIFIPLD